MRPYCGGGSLVTLGLCTASCKFSSSRRVRNPFLDISNPMGNCGQFSNFGCWYNFGHLKRVEAAEDVIRTSGNVVVLLGWKFGNREVEGESVRMV